MDRLFSILVFLTLLPVAACTKDDSADDTALRGSITLVTSAGGSGDNGYDDLALAGVMRFYERHDDVGLSIMHPFDSKEAKKILDDWIVGSSGSGGNSLIIFAGDDFIPIFEEELQGLDTNQHILLFESAPGEAHQNVSTFRICRYGASYLAGAMASECKDAIIMAAFRESDVVNEAITGFCDGYRDIGGKEAGVYYLAADETGFSMPNKAFSFAAEHDQAFIFPLAGGSNNGVYKYSREMPFSLQLVAGMDVDCSAYSTRVPFSMVIHLDDVICRLLEDWQVDGILPLHTGYTLADGDVIEILTNPSFLDNVEIFEDYYGSDGYWQSMLERYKDVAIQKEREYYGL